MGLESIRQQTSHHNCVLRVELMSHENVSGEPSIAISMSSRRGVTTRSHIRNRTSSSILVFPANRSASSVANRSARKTATGHPIITPGARTARGGTPRGSTGHCCRQTLTVIRPPTGLPKLLNRSRHCRGVRGKRSLRSCEMNMWGEADLLVTVKYGYFRNLLPSVAVVGIFSPFSSSSPFLKSLLTQSSHLRCGLPLFLEPY